MDVIQRHALARIRGDERNTTVAFAHGGAGQPVFRRSSEDISEPKFCGSRRSSPPANHHVRVRVHAACGSCSTVAVGGRARSRWHLRPSSIVRAVEVVRAHVLVRVVSCSTENPETVDRGPCPSSDCGAVRGDRSVTVLVLSYTHTQSGHLIAQKPKRPPNHPMNPQCQFWLGCRLIGVTGIAGNQDRLIERRWDQGRLVALSYPYLE